MRRPPGVRRQLVRRKNPNRGTKTDFHGNFQGRNSCLEREENGKPATLRNPKSNIGPRCGFLGNPLFTGRNLKRRQLWPRQGNRLRSLVKAARSSRSFGLGGFAPKCRPAALSFWGQRKSLTRMPAGCGCTRAGGARYFLVLVQLICSKFMIASRASSSSLCFSLSSI